jgi:hypothetical protein
MRTRPASEGLVFAAETGAAPLHIKHAYDERSDRETDSGEVHVFFLFRSDCGEVGYLPAKNLTNLMTAGPSVTTYIAGNRQKTSGKTSLTPSF